MFVKTYYISKFYYWNLFFSFKILKREKKVARRKFQKKKKRIERYLIPDEIQIRKSPLLISASLGENIDALLLEWISLTPGIRLKKKTFLWQEENINIIYEEEERAEYGLEAESTNVCPTFLQAREGRVGGEGVVSLSM